MTTMDFDRGLTEKKIIPCSGAGGGGGKDQTLQQRDDRRSEEVQQREDRRRDIEPRRRRRSNNVGNRSHGIGLVDMKSDVIGGLNSCGAIVGTSIPVDLSRGCATIGGSSVDDDYDNRSSNDGGLRRSTR